MKWNASWIHYPGHDTTEDTPVPFFRKEFELSKTVLEATARITALGLYELTINGQRVGDTELAPGWTDYRRRIPYQEYDISGFLKPGRNAIGVKLGNGWYCGRMFINKRQFYGKFPELLVQLNLQESDGNESVITSDETWKTAVGPIRMADLYDGEAYDARMELPGWDLAGYDDAAWQSVNARPAEESPVLELAAHEPVRAIEELNPVEIWEVEPGRWAFDLGQNMVGRTRLMVPGEAGRTITVRFAEMLNPDQTLYTENYRTAKSTDTYICRGNEGFETWEPVFTFHGFRYVELAGLDPAVQPDARWITGVVLHNDMEQIGRFVCSNPLLNQLQSNIVWGQKGNFLEAPTDCPQRNERLGWTGDAQVFCPTACFNFDTLDFFHKWMQDMRDAQKEDGSIPFVVPDGLRDGESPAWGDAVAVIPWEVYLRFGDRKILQDNFAAIENWINYQKNDSPGLIRADRGFGDWLQPYTVSEDEVRGDTSRSLIGTAYFAYTTSIAARVAEILVQPDKAETYTQLAGSIRKAFMAEFWTTESKLVSDTQTAYLLALAFDLLPEDKASLAFENLVRLVKEADNHLRTGFVGTPLLNATLSRFGRIDLAYEVLLKETYPGWLFSINQGATTMWERWNSYSHADGFGNVEMNSFNHYAYGAIGQWMVETIAGLAPDPDNPGYKHIFIKPQPGGDLKWAKAELKTVHGPAESSWRIEEDVLILNALIPEGTSATVVFPWGKPEQILYHGQVIPGNTTTVVDNRTAMHVESGTHTFIIPSA